MSKSKGHKASADKEIRLLRKDIQQISQDLDVMLNHASTIQSMIGRTNFALAEIAKSVGKIEFKSSQVPKPKKRK